MSIALGKDRSTYGGVVQQQQEQSPQQKSFLENGSINNKDDGDDDVDEAQDHRHHRLQLNQEEELKQFLQDDDDDDDEFIVISSRQKRLDLLLSEENNDDDDIIIVRSSSPPEIAGGKQQQNQMKLPPVGNGDMDPPTASNATFVSTLLISFLSLWYLFHLHTNKKRMKIHVDSNRTSTTEEAASKRKYNESNTELEEKDIINSPISKKIKHAVMSTNATQQKQREAAATCIDDDTTQDIKTNNGQDVLSSIPTFSKNGILSSIATITPNLLDESSNALIEKRESSSLSSHDNSAQLHSKSSSMESEGLTTITKNTVMATKTTATTTQLDFVTSGLMLPSQEQQHQMQHQERKDKLQIARGIAKDIKLVEEALKEEGILQNSAEIAKDIVKDWHFSERIIKNQKQIEFSKMQIETSQRMLDRQLSQQQHVEILEATVSSSTASNVLYDPNWKEKLQSKRDRCWDLVYKLCWEIGLIYVGSRRFGKHLKSLWMVSFGRHGVDNIGISIKDVVGSVVSNVCDCNKSSSQNTSTHAAPVVVSDTTTTAASTFNFMCSFIPNLSHTTTTYLFQYLSIGGSFSMTSIDVGMCYGSCALTICLVISFIAILHRALNLFAAPSIFHHLINGITILFFFLSNNKEETHPSSTLSSNTMATSGVLSSLLLSNPQYVTLGFCFLGMFGVVQWNYNKCQSDVERTLLLKKNSGHTTEKHLSEGELAFFQGSLQQSFNRIDALYWRLCVFRYSMIIGICCFVYNSIINNENASTSLSSSIV